MSTIIKAGAEAALPCKLRAIELSDHVAEARRAVEQARTEAARITGEARAAASGIREEAQRDGYARGHAEGSTRGVEEGAARGFEEAAREFAAEQTQLISALRATLHDIESQKRDLIIEARHDVLELALALAAKLTVAIGGGDRAAAVQNLERCLRLVGRKTDLQVRSHPADEETLRRFAAEFAEQRAELQHVTFVSDPSLAAGGCIVTVGAGEDALQVDAALETQLAQITSLLLGEPDTQPTSIEGQARG